MVTAMKSPTKKTQHCFWIKSLPLWGFPGDIARNLHSVRGFSTQINHHRTIAQITTIVMIAMVINYRLPFMNGGFQLGTSPSKIHCEPEDKFPWKIRNQTILKSRKIAKNRDEIIISNIFRNRHPKSPWVNPFEVKSPRKSHPKSPWVTPLEISMGKSPSYHRKVWNYLQFMAMVMAKLSIVYGCFWLIYLQISIVYLVGGLEHFYFSIY